MWGLLSLPSAAFRGKHSVHWVPGTHLLSHSKSHRPNSSLPIYSQRLRLAWGQSRKKISQGMRNSKYLFTHSLMCSKWYLSAYSVLKKFEPPCSDSILFLYICPTCLNIQLTSALFITIIPASSPVLALSRHSQMLTKWMNEYAHLTTNL